MNAKHSTNNTTSQSPVNRQTVVQQNSLIEASTRMIADASESIILLSLFQTKAEKQRQSRLKASVLEQSARVVDAQLAETTALMKLSTAIAEQAHIDQLRIDYQHTTGEMSRAAENDLRDAMLRLFADKSSILESLAKLDADDELKQVAAHVMTQLTLTSAEQLVRHNTKPR